MAITTRSSRRPKPRLVKNTPEARLATIKRIASGASRQSASVLGPSAFGGVERPPATLTVLAAGLRLPARVVLRAAPPTSYLASGFARPILHASKEPVVASVSAIIDADPKILGLRTQKRAAAVREEPIGLRTSSAATGVRSFAVVEMA